MAVQYFITGLASSPYYAVYDRYNSWAAVTGLPTIPGYILDYAWSDDGRYLALAHYNSPGLTVIDTSDWSVVSGTPTLTSNGKAVAFSHDGSMLAVGHNSTSGYYNRLYVYDTSDWSVIKNDFYITSNTINSLDFSPDDSEIAVGSGITDWQVRIYETTTWTYATGGTRPQPNGTVYNLAYSPDGTYLACRHASSPYISVYYTSTWNTVSKTNPAAGCGKFSWSPDSAYLACGYSNSPYVIVWDTSAWTWETIAASLGGYIYSVSFSGAGDLLALQYYSSSPLAMLDASTWDTSTDLPSTGNISGVYFGPEFGETYIFQLESKFADGFSYRIISQDDIFEGLAISHNGTVAVQGPRNGDEVLIYRRTGTEYALQDTVAELTANSTQIIEFSPGGRFVVIGSSNPLHIGTSRRVYGLYGAQVDYFWGVGLTSGGITLSLSWSADGEVFVGQYYDIYQHPPVVMTWNSGAGAYQVITPTGVPDLGYYSRAEISSDGAWLMVTSSTSGGAYDQTPYVFAFSHAGGGAFTAVTVDLNSVSFSSTYGMQISWSPDSQYCLINRSVFKWSTVNSQFEIVDTLSYGDYTRKAAWHPGSTFVAVPISNAAVIYSRSGDTFTELTTIFPNIGSAVTSACWSKDGNFLFLGGSNTSGDSFKMYSFNGSTFTADAVSDFSDITGAVVGISHTPMTMVESAGAIQHESDFTLKDTFIGTFHVCGALSVPLSLVDPHISVLQHVGPFLATSGFSAGLSPALLWNVGNLASRSAVLGGYRYFVPLVDVGTFQSENILSAVVPIHRTWPPAIDQFLCTLTGSENGLDDIVLPMSLFNCIIRPGNEKTSVTITVPGLRVYAGQVAARKDGRLVIRQGLTTSLGFGCFRTIADAQLQTIDFDERDGTMTLFGSDDPVVENAKTVNLTGVSTISMMENEKRRVRCAVDFLARPGDTANFENESMTIGQMTMIVGRGQKYMYINEAVT